MDTDQVYVDMLSISRQGMLGETYNIGTGKMYSGLEILHKICKLTGKNPLLRLDAKRFRPVKAEVTQLCCNNEKIKYIYTRAGRSKDFADIDETLKQTIEYIKNHPDEYNPDKYNI